MEDLVAKIGKWEKQSGETIAYPISCARWLAERPGNAIASYAVTAETGINVASHSKVGSIITVLLSGGTHGQRYKVTVTVTTDLSGEIKESEFFVTVKDV